MDPPATVDFVAGSEVGDKGTIKLDQVGVRGIGKKTVEFTVGVDDYRSNFSAVGGTYTLLKCDGHEGAWTVNTTRPDEQGTITFTIPDGATSAEGHAIYDLHAGDITIQWDLKGPVTFTPGEADVPPRISFATMTGTATTTLADQTFTSPNEQLPFWLDLEAGDFCT